MAKRVKTSYGRSFRDSECVRKKQENRAWFDNSFWVRYQTLLQKEKEKWGEQQMSNEADPNTPRKQQVESTFEPESQVKSRDKEQAEVKKRGKVIIYTPNSYMRYHGGRTPEEDGHACRQIRVGRNQSVYGVCIWEGDNDVWEASAAAITEIEKEHIEDDGRLILHDQQQEMIMTELCQQQSVSFNAMSQQSSGSSGTQVVGSSGTQVVGFQPGHHGVNGGTRVFGFQPGCTEGTESTQQKRPFSLLSVAAVGQA